MEGALVTRTVDGARQAGRPALRLLYAGDPTLARECLGRAGGSIEVVDAVPEPGRTIDSLPAAIGTDAPRPFDLLFIEHGYPGVDALALLKDIAARKLRIPTVIVADWDEDLAVHALTLGAGDYVTKSRASFRAVYFRLKRLIAHSSILDEHSRLRDAHDATLQHERARREHLAQRLAEVQAVWKTAESRLIESDAAIKRAHQDRLTDAVDAAKELALRETDFATRFAEARTACETLEHQLAGRDAALQHAERRAATEQQSLQEDFARRERLLQTAISAEVTLRRTLEAKLADADVALQAAEDRLLAERQSAKHRAAERQAESDAERDRLWADRDGLEQQLADAELAQRRTEERRASDAAAAEASAAALEGQLLDLLVALEHSEKRAATERHAASELASDRQAGFEAQLAQISADRSALETRFTESSLALQRAAVQHESEMSEAQARLARIQQSSDARLAEALAVSNKLQRELAETAATLVEVERQADNQRHAAAQSAAERQAGFDAALVREAAERATLANALRESEAQRQAAEQQFVAEMRAAAAQLATHEEQAAAATEALEQQLRAAEAATVRAEQQAALERETACELAATRQAEFDARLGQERVGREALEAQLAQERAGRDGLEAQLAQERASRDGLEARLRESSAELQRTAEQHASEMAAAEIRFSEAVERSEARLAEAAAHLASHQEQAARSLAAAVAAGEALEQRLIAADAATQRAEQQASAERETASALAGTRQAEFDAQLAAEATRYLALEEQLRRTEAAFTRAEKQHASEMAGAEARLTETQNAAEARLTEALSVAGGLQRALTDTATAVERVERQAAVDRQTASDERARLQEAFELELAQEVTARQALAALLADTEAAFTQETWHRQSLERALGEAREASEQAQRRFADESADLAQRAQERQSRLETMVAERESQLHEQAARHQAAHEESAAKLAGVEQRLEQAVAIHVADTHLAAQLHDRLKHAGKELDAARRQREVLKSAADRVPELQTQLDGLRADHRRRFGDSPVPMCRYSRDGSATDVNAAMARLLGYTKPGDVHRLDFADAVFESVGELQWVIERCLASRATESIETTWRRRDGRRKIVRLLAVPITADSIELVAEDLTRVRTLEEKLRNAQRMEAVARFGSEVAVTCHALLRHVKQEGQQWVAQMDSDTARYRGELLLDEVTRAAGFLGQLAAYGNEQKNVAERVDVNSVLRDLEPVLKRVAGHHIDLVLPQASGSLNVDVEEARLERMLVNVAAYGRERMPLGGRLMFEIAPVVLDRDFVAKYPNVRPGAHVLLTIHEVRDALGANMSVVPRTEPADHPGVDLGALQTLVGGCGGHLWMMAEPPGNMVLKIHLPRRVLDRSDPRPVSHPAGRPRWIHRAFGARH